MLPDADKDGYGFNRYIVECKLACGVPWKVSIAVLIDT